MILKKLEMNCIIKEKRIYSYKENQNNLKN